MSKKLESILSRVPPATASQPDREKKETYKAAITYCRIVAVVPMDVKKQLKIYLAENPGETEKTILLKALKAFGFNVPEEEIKDQRGKGGKV